MSCIIEDNFTLKMFSLPNFKRRRKRLDNKNKNENNRYQLFSTRGKKLWGDAMKRTLRSMQLSRTGNAGGVFLRAKNRAGRSIDRFLEADLTFRVTLLRSNASSPTLSRLIKRDSLMYSFMGRAFLSCWYAGRWKRRDRWKILSFFLFKIFANNLKLIFLSALSFLPVTPILEMKERKRV